MKAFDFTNPASWNFLGAVYLYTPSSDDYADMISAMFDEMAALNDADHNNLNMYDYKQAHEVATKDSRFDTKGTCDHCGAHFHYGAMYQNVDTGEHAVVGNICASNKLNLTAHEYADVKLREMVKQAKSRALGNCRINALAPNRRTAIQHDHPITNDMRSRFRKWGSLSIKQWALAKKLAYTQVVRAQEAEAAEPVVEGSAVTIEGEVVGLKWVPGYAYGSPDTLKIIVKDDRGFKVYGSAAAPLMNHDVDKGFRVRFIAGVEKSKQEETFGFFKRPRKAEVLFVPVEVFS